MKRSGQGGDHVQRGIARAEVVHFDLESQLSEPADRLDDLPGVLGVGRLGDLEPEIAGSEPVFLKNREQGRNEVGIVHVDARRVHRHGHREVEALPPFLDLGGGRAPDVVVEGLYEPVLLEEGNEDAGTDQAEGGMLPAHQGLGAREHRNFGSHVELGLVVDLELPLGDSAGEVLDELVMVERLPVHLGIVGGNVPREVVAHRVGRDLGAVEAPLHVYALVHGFVDAHAQAHARARRVAHERGGDALHELPVAGAVGNIEQEGVRTAPAGEALGLLGHPAEAGAYLPEDLVAVGFAEALVDHVEMVHVDEGRVHVQLLVEHVELLGVAEEVLARVEAGDGVALRVFDDLPVLVELHGAADAGQDDFGVGIALGDEVACAEFQALDFGVLLARHDDDGDLAQLGVLFQGAQHVLAAEAGHVQVQKH